LSNYGFTFTTDVSSEFNDLQQRIESNGVVFFFAESRITTDDASLYRANCEEDCVGRADPW